MIARTDVRTVQTFLDRPRGKRVPTPDVAYAAGRRILAGLGIEPPTNLTAAWLGQTLRERRIIQ
jgi:hypothetical protein